MNRYRRYIALTLLLVFMSSMAVRSAAAATNWDRIGDHRQAGIIMTGQCSFGTLAADNPSVPEHPHLSTDGDIQQPFQLAQQADTSSESDADRVIVTNCQMSMQLLPADSMPLKRPPGEMFLHSDILLMTSQLYAQGIADPPRSV